MPWTAACDLFFRLVGRSTWLRPSYVACAFVVSSPGGSRFGSGSGSGFDFYFRFVRYAVSAGGDHGIAFLQVRRDLDRIRAADSGLHQLLMGMIVAAREQHVVRAVGILEQRGRGTTRTSFCDFAVASTRTDIPGRKSAGGLRTSNHTSTVELPEIERGADQRNSRFHRHRLGPAPAISAESPT